MVVSKRCKVCSVIDTNNAPISGNYFDKCLPDIITKICGIEIDPHKAKGTLICQLCIIQLMHTDMVIDKLRCALIRLKKNVKEIKAKTPLKGSFASQNRKVNDGNKSNIENGSDVEPHVDNARGQLDIVSHSPKIARRKSIYADGKIGVFGKIAETPNPKNENQKENEMDGDDAELSAGDVEHKTEENPSKSTRKSVFIDAKSVGASARKQKNSENPNNENVTKFKKFLDLISPDKTEVKASKRKPETIAESSEFSLEKVDVTPIKRNKISLEHINEDSPMNSTVDEKDSNKDNNEKEKVKNCILCGKMCYSNSSLRKHILEAHMGERLKACPHCSSEFRSKQKYESHVFNEKCKNTNHACQYQKCNKRFKTIHKMELHMQEKHSSVNESGDE